MASDKYPLTLMNIPLELRYRIFQYVARRDTQPEKLLRYWFEKKEVKEKTAQLVAQNPSGAAPVIVFDGDQYDHEEEYEEGDGSGEDDEEGEEDSDAEEGTEDEGDSDEDEDQEDGEDLDEEAASEDGDEAEDQDAENDSTVAHMTPAPAALFNTHAPAAPALTSSQQTTVSTSQAPAVSSKSTGSTIAAQDSAFAVSDQPLAETESDPSVLMDAANSSATTTAQAPTTAATASVPDILQMHDQENAEGGDADTHTDDHNDPQLGPVDGAAEDEDIQENENVGEKGDGQEDDENIDQESDDEDGNNANDGESDEEMDEDHDDTAAGAARTPSPAPIITAHRKWRHIPKFMQITHCPPPVELLLACKQLNNEAKSWFYDVAIFCIEATGSFAHTSFFEEAFSQITEAAFSPMEDIRKAEITFVWDTAWLRSDQAGCADAIFPALLRQRAAFVVGILAQAPNLCDVVIHWHDSAQDDESVDLMNDVLTGFLGLSAAIKVKLHYIAADAKPYRKSVAGRRRVEFQNIVENGLDRLF
ncbi:uncharacterized protein EKO05_0011155 [Ascochyta rabiei]|uniref:Uncharacterized protein n=1 Tax=Didymella rabiei TaxID=5454 RepID=A0A163A8J3_DIDRA|nr:uncharacterized protein EKO05_0011155 [Ascochyta rabiei]KZM21047.1 hypothetical protein ST47_g7828 [Ascochyta rabiei]UPX20945.1 hypothetical protein EKO05_0011155 [Ascochyta rabiei]